MSSATFTVHVEPDVKKRLEKMTKATGRSRSSLAAEALTDYLDAVERQTAGIEQAIESFECGAKVGHGEVNHWVKSWGSRRERPVPGRSKTR